MKFAYLVSSLLLLGLFTVDAVAATASPDTLYVLNCFDVTGTKNPDASIQEGIADMAARDQFVGVNVGVGQVDNMKVQQTAQLYFSENGPKTKIQASVVSSSVFIKFFMSSNGLKACVLKSGMEN